MTVGILNKFVESAELCFVGVRSGGRCLVHIHIHCFAAPSKACTISFPTRDYLPAQNPIRQSTIAAIRGHTDTAARGAIPRPSPGPPHPLNHRLSNPSSSHIRKKAMPYFKITLIRSGIGLPAKTNGVLRALGLTKRMATVFHPVTADTAGQIMKIKELVAVSEVAQPLSRREMHEARRPDPGFYIERVAGERWSWQQGRGAAAPWKAASAATSWVDEGWHGAITITAGQGVQIFAYGVPPDAEDGQGMRIITWLYFYLVL
ncbi:hypothetical protein FH972_023294 [Carpinus fangiana]|uniref:Large ribosomal subunit protein uL30m n=1 Tax=Carpinus fangiana TaxID=176857 RepID=A0A5N6KUT1_9ROSI|nr:hypothetical protein FH972_023294 [Carpinus fangiana]